MHVSGLVYSNRSAPTVHQLRPVVVGYGSSGQSWSAVISYDFVCSLEDIENTHCIGPKDCLYPHPKECNKFIRCEVSTDGVTGEPTVKDCPAGLEWNDNKKECDWPIHSTCPREPSTKPPTQSPTQKPQPTPQPPESAHQCLLRINMEVAECSQNVEIPDHSAQQFDCCKIWIQYECSIQLSQRWVSDTVFVTYNIYNTKILTVPDHLAWHMIYRWNQLN
ncbi:unnamed protein product [Oppiella nova]|uniref:Chitin-binding type-2 domain-containing protein n=1 Tax=Oppiella nova TaxID=334625 RepID=A0A7R9QIT1_9ACAR|nr:unnamed protein product [Oppiella nova]CAG2166206.1 unnamed protein product [Oppiella nova]